MCLLPPFCFFSTSDSPIGFGVADYLELAFAAFFAALLFLWVPVLRPALSFLNRRPKTSLAALAAMPVALRLLLLVHHPVPTPDVYDEFGHLLVADTLRHLRLANPPHALSQFFETFFLLQQPTYSSIYPLGQGIALALGWTLLGLPWAGVLLTAAAFSGACYWMLRGWTTPAWALAGTLLAVVEFGPLNPWMNCYWGGSVAAFAGCLIFGSLPRLHTHQTRSAAIILGCGLSLHLLTRPYESVFVVIAVIAYFLPDLCRRATARALMQPALIAAICVVPAIALTLAQNKSVTHSWTTLPYQLSQYQYGVPSALTIQPNPVPHRELTPQQALDYKMQVSFHGPQEDTLRSYFLRLEYRVRLYRFFFLPELYLVFPFFFCFLRKWQYLWAAFACLLLALGVNFFPAFQFHYVAACTCLFVLIAIKGVERLSTVTVYGKPAGRQAAVALLCLCGFHFTLWFTVHAFEGGPLDQAREFETWNGINHDSANSRNDVNRQLARVPGKLLVFVRYWPTHIFQKEWVYNAADVDGARIVWARDISPDENRKLIEYYRGRTILLLEPDAQPPQLSPYDASTKAQSTVVPGAALAASPDSAAHRTSHATSSIYRDAHRSTS